MTETYRLNAGVVVFNRKRQVLLCRRSDEKDAWQFPQGGIEKGETPAAAALRELEEDQLIHREVYPIVPPKTEYSLTELGKTLIPLITELREWGRYYFEYTHQPNPCEQE